jgi:hypothetical protein
VCELGSGKISFFLTLNALALIIAKRKIFHFFLTVPTLNQIENHKNMGRKISRKKRNKIGMFCKFAKNKLIKRQIYE